MRQYVLPDDYNGSPSLEISGEENHYLTRVLKKHPGDRFSGLDPRGRRVTILLKSSAPGRCILDITSETTKSSDAPEKGSLDIILFQCIPKARKMDTIIRQAVEIGVTRVVPVQSENAVPKLDGESSDRKQQRWQRIARQAMQQSGNQRTLGIDKPVSLYELPHIWSAVSSPGDVSLVFHEKQLSETPLHHLLSPATRAVGICIGPEGGFSTHEVANLLQSGFQPVYINTNVLRTETAALYAVAAVQTVIMEKDSWTVR